MRRRRLLTIAAAFAARPAFSGAPTRWEGIALGARARLELDGPPGIARPALAAALAAIRRAEALWSLHDPASEISRLNREGRIRPSPETAALLSLCDRIHALSGGLFDPTVQPLWEALARGGDAEAARARVGWDRVRLGGTVRLGAGQAITLNGIAQGAATDAVMAALRAHGVSDAHVSVGEEAAMGRARRLGLSDPEFGLVGALSLRRGALATSSPAATPVGPHGHILSPSGAAPLWSTVTVEAETAALADGLSTALCLAGAGMARRASALPQVRRVVLVDREGDLRTV